MPFGARIGKRVDVHHGFNDPARVFSVQASHYCSKAAAGLINDANDVVASSLHMEL